MEYNIGQRLNVKIVSIRSNGIYVALPNYNHGYIRRRNLDLNPRIALDKFKVGETVEAEIISVEEGFELSIRALLPNPWDIPEKLPKIDEIVRGHVTQVNNDDLYFEIIPGVNGYIHRRDISKRYVTNANNYLFERDIVEGIVKKIDFDNRKVHVSLKQRIDQLEKASWVLYKIPLDDEDTEFGTEGTKNPALSSYDVFIPDHIDNKLLIIDDDERISAEISDWLFYRGWRVTQVTTVDDAIKKIKKEIYKLIILDLNLGTSNGVNVLNELKKFATPPPVILISIPNAVRARIDDLRTPIVADVLFKPFTLPSLDQSVSLCMSQRHRKDIFNYLDDFSNQRFINFHFDITNSTQSFDFKLHLILNDLLQIMNADSVSLFERDPITGQINVRNFVGNKDYKMDDHKLNYSPVHNVMEDNELVSSPYIYKDKITKRKFEYLSNIVAFNACIGIPISIQGETNHALFAFFNGKRYFDTSDEYMMKATVTLVRASFEENELDKRLKRLSTVITKGELTDRLFHEVRNNLQRIQSTIDNIILNETVDYENRINSVRQDLNRLNDAVTVFESTKGRFGIEKTNIVEIVSNILNVVNYMATKDDVKIINYMNIQDPQLIETSPLALQQILINLILNSIQHITIMKKMEDDQRNGIIEIRLQKLENYYNIDISDNGPGIHYNLWNRVFNPGFTTRQSGSGLGLSISRSFAQSINAELYIKNSTMLIGTTFTLRIPILD